MKKIRIIALTEKGEEIIKTSEKPTRTEKAVHVLFKIKEKVTNLKPYTIEVIIKRFMPDEVFRQIPLALEQKFFELGGTLEDFKIEVDYGR